MGELVQTYCFPLYAYLRRRGNAPSQAEDLVQGFFARLLEKDALALVDRERGKFRSFLLASLQNFLANEWDKSRAAKRGGGAEVVALSKTPRYAPLVAAVRRRKGVGLLTAMVFLTEVGDMTRFKNRRQTGAFLGLTPSTYESGENDDHKGHITRQGSPRVLKVLCQAVWSRLRVDEHERKTYDRIVSRNPKHKKIAVVARMRTLGVMMWHDALEAQLAMQASQAQPAEAKAVTA